MEGVLSVDRIEGGFAICEDESGDRRDIPLSELPEGVGEGDCLRVTSGGYLIDRDETARRRAKNKALFEKLRAKSGK